MVNKSCKLQVVIIGIGQEWRGDDAAGLLVARHLQKQQPKLKIREMSGSAPDLLAVWQEEKAVIVVDAVYTNTAPGTIYRFEAHAEPLPADIAPACSTHNVGLAEAIALGRRLQRLPPCLIIYGIAGKHFGLGDQLSHAVEQAIPLVSRQILEEVKNINGQSMGLADQGNLIY